MKSGDEWHRTTRNPAPRLDDLARGRCNDRHRLGGDRDLLACHTPQKAAVSAEICPLIFINSSRGLSVPPTRTVIGASTPLSARRRCRSNREGQQFWRTCWWSCSAKRASAATSCARSNASTTARPAICSAPVLCTLSSIPKLRKPGLQTREAAGQSTWIHPRSLINTKSRS